MGPKATPRGFDAERLVRRSRFRPSLTAREDGGGGWHPHQLRPSYATNVRREFGLEAAQILLGPSKADVTQIYAERDMDRPDMPAENARMLAEQPAIDGNT